MPKETGRSVVVQIRIPKTLFREFCYLAEKYSEGNRSLLLRNWIREAMANEVKEGRVG